MGENETFVAQNIATGAPGVANSTITQIHNFTANNVVCGSPIVSDTSIPSTAIGTNDIEAGQPFVGSPFSFIINNFTATNIVTGTPEISTSEFVQTMPVTGIVAGTPVLSSPTITNIPDFRPNIITVIPAAIVDRVVMTQNHFLGAESIVTPSPTVVVTMEWNEAEISPETYTEVSANITGTWAEEEIAASDPWTQLAA